MIKYAEEEKKAEENQHAMGQHDVRPQVVEQQVIEVDDKMEAAVEIPVEPMAVNPGGAASSSSVPIDPGLMVPVTPPRDSPEISSPRTLGLIRPSEGGEEDASQKREQELMMRRNSESTG